MNKRALTETEIEYILSDIEPISCLDKIVSNKIFENIKHTFSQLLRKQVVYPTIIDDLKQKITRQYYHTQIQAGESVGILTAQSIGERQTQLCLNTFHSTGITTDTVVSGVPRFSELLSATKNPKNTTTTIYINKPYTDLYSLQTEVSYKLVYVRVQDVITKIDTEVMNMDTWYNAFNIIYGEMPTLYDKFVRLFCDIEILYRHRLKLKDIAHKIMEQYEDIKCAWSPDNMCIIDIWFNSSSVFLPEGPTFINEDNKIDIYVENILIPNVNTIPVNGIEGIKQAHYIKDIKTNEWYIEMVGANLMNVLASDVVNNKTTFSNNMWEIYEVLGIEATRYFLINEFLNIITIDSYINAPHVHLLVDTMLYTGTISSISRYGVHRNQSGVLTKCSFEESLDQILKAGIYGEDEVVKGVSAAIICGKVSNIGTGLCDLIYNDKNDF